MPLTLFTLGYEKRSIGEYIGLLVQFRINVLIDVRETAWSHKPGFSKSALGGSLARVGIDYLHAPLLGNPKWLRATASSHAECLSLYDWYLNEHTELVDSLDLLIADLLRAGKRVCLTCFERHADDCHRSILAEKWVRRGRRTVSHLATEGCKRLVSA